MPMQPPPISLPRFISVPALIQVLAVVIALACASAIQAQERRLQIGPGPLGQFINQQPRKLAVVMVSTPGCPFCELVRTRELASLLRDAQFLDIGFFEVLMRDDGRFDPAIPLDNKRVDSPAQLSELLSIRMAPTLLFLGGGTELAERLVGYGVPDYYGAYLEERIHLARLKLAEMR